jgi:rod shape-determining protein MreC
MGRIFLFLYQYRAFFTFLLLELFCIWLIVQNNRYQGAQFFNSANTLVGGINTFSQNVRDYFSLREINTTLADENAWLRDKLEQLNQSPKVSSGSAEVDSALIHRFEFVNARIVNNSVDRYTNFITIDKGNNAGIKPGMAVMSSAGAIGKVKLTSRHFSVVTSLLNINLRVSALVKRTHHFGTVQWDGKNPLEVDLNYIPRHVNLMVGDTIVTSGYSGVFPEGIVIGTIASIELREEAPFYELQIRLAEDFRKLSFVTVIKSNLLHELDSLEQHIPDMNP